MSLEKLLIFGFSLAVMSAVILSASGMNENREVEETGYRTEINNLKAKAP